MDSFPRNGEQAQAVGRVGKDRAPRISNEKWETHKKTIETLWITMDLTIDEVLRNLEQHHNFSPSTQQLKNQVGKVWGFYKNKLKDREPRGEKRPADPDPDFQQAPRTTPALDSSTMPPGPYTANGGGYAAQWAGPTPQQSMVTGLTPPALADMAAPVSSAEEGDSDGDQRDEFSPEFLSFAREQWRKSKGKSTVAPQPVSQNAPALPDISRGNDSLPGMDATDFPVPDNLADSNPYWGPPPFLRGQLSPYGYSPHICPLSFPGQPPISYWPQDGGNGLYNGDKQLSQYNKANMPSDERVNIIGTKSGRNRPTRTTKSRQAIHQSAQAGNIQAIEMFIERDPGCVDVRTGEGITPLWIAAQGGYYNIVKLLISREADVNIAGVDDDRTPLHQAAQNGHIKIVELLLNRGAKPDPVDRNGLTPLWSAAQNGHQGIVELILKKKPTSNLEAESADGRRPLHQAAQCGHLGIVRLLLDKGASPDEADNAGTTPLWSAAQQGHHEIVELLAEREARLDVASNEGARQPMHQAAQNGHLETVKVLIEAGATPTPEANSYDTDTPSPFWLACAAGKVEIVRLLLDYDADVNFAVGRSGKTSLHAAAYGGRTEIADLLLEKNCDIDAKEETGWTALMLAAQEGHRDFLKRLVDKRADIDAAENDGATALWIASQQGHLQIVSLLLEKGAKQLPTRSANRRPLHQAAQNGHLSVVKLLLDGNPGDIDAVDKKGATPLLLASQENKPNYTGIIKFLLSRGARTSV